MKVLALQDPSYYKELGIDFCGCEVVFGLPSFSFAKRALLGFDLVVSCLDHDEDALRVVLLANYMQIPTAYFLDGIYDVCNASNNPSFKKSNLRLLFPARYGVVFSVGAKFSDWYRQEYPFVTVVEYLPERARLKKVSFDGEKCVLVTTALTPYFDDEDFDSVVSELNRVVSSLKGFGEKIRFRIFDKRLLQAIPGAYLMNDVDESLSSALAASKCVVSTTSTVLHSCNLYGIPSILVNHRGDEVLYDVDYVLCRGDMLDEVKFKSVLCEERNERDLNVGVVLKDFEFHSVNELSFSSKDFFNFGFRYLIRRLYRTFPKNLRWKIKRIFFR